ncbi:MAG: F0F1 ATP synthase subunit B [Saprospiraceae bacterium]|nr:F0F1 ATP synthase subunit B [Saprospiraceae bacterium]
MEFNPIKPDLGLILWTVVIFAIFWLLIAKTAFKPIANALKKREEDIQGALDEAKKAKEEMSNLKAANEKLLAEAREERAKMLKEAKETKNKIVTEAKQAAKDEAAKVMNQASLDIENQKKAAMMEVKNEIGAIALSIAEKVIRKELAGNSEQESFVNSLVDDVKLN